MAKSPRPNPLFFQLFEQRPRKGDLRKIEIVQAAIRLIGRRGIQSATLESIGEQVGISKSLVSYHFSSVADIVEAAVRFIIADAQRITIEQVSKESAWEGQVRAYIRAAFLWAEMEPEQASVLMLFQHLCTCSKKMAKMQVDIRDAGRKRLGAILATRSAGLTLQGCEELAGAIQALATAKMIEYITCRPARSASRMQREAIRGAFQLVGAADLSSS